MLSEGSRFGCRKVKNKKCCRRSSTTLSSLNQLGLVASDFTLLGRLIERNVTIGSLQDSHRPLLLCLRLIAFAFYWTRNIYFRESANAQSYQIAKALLGFRHEYNFSQYASRLCLLWSTARRFNNLVFALTSFVTREINSPRFRDSSDFMLN